MKKIYIVLLLFSSMMAACKKSGTKSSSSVIGQWKLVSYSGGIAGFRHHPATTNATLTFTSDSQVTFYKDGQTIETTRFHINNHYPFSSTYITKGMRFGLGSWLTYGIQQGVNDTLSFGEYNAPDYLYPEYQRTK